MNVQQKIKIRKGDQVIMKAGKDAGKTGKVVKVLPGEYRLVVDGLNLLKKNIRPKKRGEKGQIVSVPGSVRVDNVQIVCSSCNKGSRIGYRVKGDKKERYCKRCNNKV